MTVPSRLSPEARTGGDQSDGSAGDDECRPLSLTDLHREAPLVTGYEQPTREGQQPLRPHFDPPNCWQIDGNSLDGGSQLVHPFEEELD